MFYKLKTEQDENDKSKQKPNKLRRMLPKNFSVEPDARHHVFKIHSKGSYRKPPTLENKGFSKSDFSFLENQPRRIRAIQFSKFALDIILIFARRPFMARAFVFFVNR